jgi:hypothetical protein
LSLLLPLLSPSLLSPYQNTILRNIMEHPVIGVATTNHNSTVNNNDSADNHIVVTEHNKNCKSNDDQNNIIANEFEPADNDDIIASHINYVQNLLNKSQLHIIQLNNVKKAYKNAGVLGLFHLFIPSSWFESMREWTNKRLISKGKKVVTKNEFRAYI